MSALKAETVMLEIQEVKKKLLVSQAVGNFGH